MKSCCPDFVETPGFYTLCVTAKTFGQRPSAMLGITDPYTAYCLDEAGFFLLAKGAPNYKKLARKKKKLWLINKDPQAMKLLELMGAKVNIGAN